MIKILKHMKKVQEMEQVAANILPQFVNILCLQKFKFECYIMHSKDAHEKFKIKGVSKTMAFLNWEDSKKYPRKYSIILFYNRHKDSREVIASVLHELLHVKFRAYDRAIKSKYKDYVYNLEESIVRNLENVIMNFIK